PAMVSKVRADAPGNALAGDIADLLEFTPGVEVSGTPRRNGQTAYIRGIDDDGIITLIDGRRQNFSSTHDGRFYIDPVLLKSVEVVRGAASASYGGGAIGGVVAFETKDAADFLQPGQNRGGAVSFGYRGGSRKEYSLTTSGAVRSELGDLLGSATYLKSGDIKLGDGNTISSEDKPISGLLKMGYTLADFHTLGFSVSRHVNDGQEPNNGNSAVTNSNPLVLKKVADSQYSLTYDFAAADDSQDLGSRMHLYFNETEVREEDISGRNNGRVQTRTIETVGFDAGRRTVLEPTAGGGATHQLSYGIEIYRDRQVGTRQQSPTVAVGTRDGVPNAEANSWGIYLQDEVAVNFSGRELQVIPALRYDSYKSADKTDKSQKADAFSPKLSLRYKPSADVMVFASLAKAFRAPHLTELYAAGTHFSFFDPSSGSFVNNTFVSTPDLKPEKVVTFELGAGIGFAGEQGMFKGAVFKSEGKDFISSQVRRTTTTNLNVAAASLFGAEIEGRYQSGALALKLGVSYVEAKNKDTGQHIDNNVPVTFVADVSYRLAGAGVLGWRSRLARANNKFSPGGEATAGYGVHDLYYRLKIGTNQQQGWTLDVGVDNVGDKAYTKRFANQLEEGRSFMLRVAYQ
ncbi:MAG: TonB-dependent receptor, partial [Betaproteobacteria bacterium]|nr:TonB-dependent receptor [Betaproteobacteria bacterium]